MRLYALRNGQQLSTKAVANFTRSELATALRKVRQRCSGQRAGDDNRCVFNPTAEALRGSQCLLAPAKLVYSAITCVGLMMCLHLVFAPVLAPTLAVAIPHQPADGWL